MSERTLRCSMFSSQSSFAEPETQFLAALGDDAARISIPNLIFDEGQDFEGDWIEWLVYRTQGRVFVF